MKSLYDLLGVSEKAERQDILNAYNNIINRQTDERKVNQLKIAVDILLNPEKRKRYDSDLNKMRAEELIKSVDVSSKSEEIINQNKEEIDNEEYKKNLENVILEEAKRQLDEKARKEKEILSHNAIKSEFEKIEEKEYEKALKKEEKLRKKEIRKAKLEYKEAYAEAYHEELKKMGYDVKAPWTRKRIKSLIISLVTVIVIIFIVSKIPFVRNAFKDLYDSNIIIKSLVDIFISILNAIKMTFDK
ncbi:MAG: hypothetical protein HFJ46_03885 [Clostridia bacterium]|nr:hypothetical protein [Clostridia bacterium]